MKDKFSSLANCMHTKMFTTGDSETVVDMLDDVDVKCVQDFGMPVNILHIPKIRILRCATVSTSQGAIRIPAALSCLCFVYTTQATAVDDLHECLFVPDGRMSIRVPMCVCKSTKVGSTMPRLRSTETYSARSGCWCKSAAAMWLTAPSVMKMSTRAIESTV